MEHLTPDAMPWSTTRPKSNQYGATHAKARRAAAAHHQPTDPCTRCGHPLGPMGPHLHYDHTDDRTTYAGFAHAACNTRAGARVGNRRSHAARRTTTLNW